MERDAGSHLPGYRMEEIQDARIDGGDLSRPVVSENVIDFLQCVGTIFPSNAILRIQGFTRVRIVQRKPADGGGGTKNSS